MFCCIMRVHDKGMVISATLLIEINIQRIGDINHVVPDWFKVHIECTS